MKQFDNVKCVYSLLFYILYIACMTMKYERFNTPVQSSLLCYDNIMIINHNL